MGAPQPLRDAHASDGWLDSQVSIHRKRKLSNFIINSVVGILVFIMSGREAPKCRDSRLRLPRLLICEHHLLYGTLDYSSSARSLSVVRLSHQLPLFSLHSHNFLQKVSLHGLSGWMSTCCLIIERESVTRMTSPLTSTH